MRWLSCILIACAGALPHAQADQVTARVTGGPHDAYFAIDFHNRDGLIAGLDGETLVSKDGGQTWRRCHVWTAPVLQAQSLSE